MEPVRSKEQDVICTWGMTHRACMSSTRVLAIEGHVQESRALDYLAIDHERLKHRPAEVRTHHPGAGRHALSGCNAQLVEAGTLVAVMNIA